MLDSELVLQRYSPHLLSKDQARTNVVNEIMNAEREYVKHLKDVIEVSTEGIFQTTPPSGIRESDYWPSRTSLGVSSLWLYVLTRLTLTLYY